MCMTGYMDAYLQTGQSQYRGGKRFKGGGRGKFHHHGRGRGRGGGRYFPPNTSGPAISNVVSEQAAAAITSVPQSSSSVPGQLLLSAPAQVLAAPLRLPPHKAWCEICKVECNTAEILEQHKNGKRHKKNLLVHEELQRLKAINRQQSGQMPTSQLNSAVQPGNVQESEKNGHTSENMNSGAPNNNHKNETELQTNTGETSEVATEEAEEKPGENFAVGRRGFKRKMRGGGRGGKYMRGNDGPRRPVEPPIAKQPIPFICELCNVKCESQVVFDSHLTGKKHLSSLKRVHGPQALYGGGGPQAPHPPPFDINALSNSINQQVQQGASDPQVLLAQLLMNYVLSQTQLPATAPPLGHVPAQVPASTPAVSQHVSENQVSEGTRPGKSDNPTGEKQIEMLSVPAQLDVPEGSSTKTQIADGSSESQVKMVNLITHDNSVMALPENPDAANDHIPSQ
ncbi:hypothetical protein L6164_000723 [Bauhinia variegata]|uniref:Uncharacterized protein n=1 Tax=Bauhinia variegata TaxID=167791 RepID=A0ACB9Q7G5_BAUVA|nr:hypothetical protein L6164_000723 [Bauhinia variegata]